MTEPWVPEGTLLWSPSREFQRQAVISRYMEWLAERRGLSFESYDALWSWSVDDPEDFWSSIWEFFDVRAARPYSRVLADRRMPGARWFVGAELNYAENVLRNATDEWPALIFRSETCPRLDVSWRELREQVVSVSTALRALGVRQGDRVVAYLPNIPEAVVAFLACASIGAVWSSCSPDFGVESVIDRFRQIEPKVLIAVDGYQYGGKRLDRGAVVERIRQALPTLEHTVFLPYLAADSPPPSGAIPWSDLLKGSGELEFTPVPFDHPLWILYSSGTTGLPKPIVQGHGGILIDHLRALGLHLDLHPGDRYFWFTTTGWMMWNYVVSGLLTGATILLYDGSPTYPDLGVLWEFAQRTGATLFGTSAPYLMACRKAGLEPGRQFDLRALRSIGSTAAPLPPEGFAWVYEHVKQDLWLASASGGTDICSILVGGCPLLPVYSGEIQCRALGAKVEAFDEDGRPVRDQVGELVVTEPMPSMPLYFWNDPDGERYRGSYFDRFPGVWRHGDWIKITSRGSIVIYGRSDSTINRQGVRMGSSEVYSVVEALPEVEDSLVVGVELPGGRYYMPLFVVLASGAELTGQLRSTIRRELRTRLSPRHVPDEILVIPEVPRTLNGKKMEVPIKRILSGVPVERALNMDSVRNPWVLAHFQQLAARLGGTLESGV